MRTWGLLALCFLSYFRVHAQFISHCTFYTEDDMKFTVYLDGEKKNEEPQTRVRVLNLTEPHFKLKIVFADTAYEPIIRKAFPLQDSKGYPVDVTYSISKTKKGFYKMHFMDQKIYPGYIKPSQTKPRPPVAKDSLKIQEPNSCSASTLSNEAYSEAIASLRNIKSDEHKFLPAKQIIVTNCLTVHQIKGIIETVDSEEKRLQLAKEAYPHTTDKGNFFMLNGLFKNEENISELYKAISR